MSIRNRIYLTISVLSFTFALSIPSFVFASGKDLISEIDPQSSSTELNTIMNELDQIPEDVVDLLKENNITVRIIDKTEEFNNLKQGEIFGLARAISPTYYVYSNKKVKIREYGYIECFTSKNVKYEYGSITHEIGHELDYLKIIDDGKYTGGSLGYSESEEWKELYEDNLTKFTKIDRVSKVNVPRSEAEGFAEAFRIMLINPKKLKKSCPDIYNYMLSIIRSEEINIDDFNYVQYADRYPDLKKQFRYDKEKLYNHYISYGIKEGRTAE